MIISSGPSDLCLIVQLNDGFGATITLAENVESKTGWTDRRRCDECGVDEGIAQREDASKV